MHISFFVNNFGGQNLNVYHFIVSIFWVFAPNECCSILVKFVFWLVRPGFQLSVLWRNFKKKYIKFVFIFHNRHKPLYANKLYLLFQMVTQTYFPLHITD